MSRWGAVIGIYVVLSLAAGAGAQALTGSPFTAADPWLTLSPVASHGYSLLFGLTFGLVMVVATKTLVHRAAWARTLHDELRPYTSGLTTPIILLAALFSALGEELLFRALLLPWVGIFAQAIIFGLVHQLPGRARWIWVSWAAVMGLCLGVVFQATGSLLGPILAHATINALNLRFLKHHEATTTPRPLGGVLGQRI